MRAQCHAGVRTDTRIVGVVKGETSIHLSRVEGRLTAAGAFDLSPRPNHLKILETGQMSISMYRLTVPMFQRGLASLKTYLDKAEAYAKEKNIDPAILVAARLAPDMLPLSGQYQRASDTAKFALARLTATDAPKFEDNETTFDDLRERLAKTEAYLAGFSAQALEGTETRQITLPGRAVSYCQVTNISPPSPCRTSISTSRRPTPSCVARVLRSASAIISAEPRFGSARTLHHSLNRNRCKDKIMR